MFRSQEEKTCSNWFIKGEKVQAFTEGRWPRLKKMAFREEGCSGDEVWRPASALEVQGWNIYGDGVDGEKM